MLPHFAGFTLNHELAGIRIVLYNMCGLWNGGTRRVEQRTCAAAYTSSDTLFFFFFLALLYFPFTRSYLDIAGLTDIAWLVVVFLLGLPFRLVRTARGTGWDTRICSLLLAIINNIVVIFLLQFLATIVGGR